MTTFDLTPDPKVLIALTRTPLTPLDALCELIDNSIDGFAAATVQGLRIENPVIAIDLPSRAEIRDGQGAVQIRDNGPGMTAASTEASIKAGFSGNNPYDSLGLFGMGFNIATGKLGRRTRLVTCRADEEAATDVTVDLERIRVARSFQVPYNRIAKPNGFVHGTLLQVSGWWPAGDANQGFISKLVQYGLPSIRREVGRRYAAILRKKKIRISINNGECEPFEHCVWGQDRFVERRGHGQIPAQLQFDKVIGSLRRCSDCTAALEAQQAVCPACGSDRVRTVDERVRGWVGVQRFDHATNYGIDLIRNGRAIRIAEKDAFFQFEDELKRITKDYPIDSQYGRIIGEVHLDHVPVDFLKQDFQRSSPEWARAMTFLRGDSSLQPQTEGADQNESPLFRIYQGYRRVRTPGRADMYMGFWDSEEERPKRISREKEKELYQLFEQRLPGYFDDSEWWKLVEQADQPPPLELSTCGVCEAQNPADSELCQVCGAVLIGHPCLNPECGNKVPNSAEVCPSCGTRQTPEDDLPWICAICRRRNASSDVSCASCGAPRNAPDPLNEDGLVSDSARDDLLSRGSLSLRLPDGSMSQPVDLEVLRVSRGMIPFGRSERLPLIRFSSLARCRVFIDTTHPLFRSFRLPAEAAIAQAVAEHLLGVAPRPSDSSLAAYYTIPSITALVLRALLGDPANPEEVLRQEVRDLLERMHEKLTQLDSNLRADILQDMPQDEKEAIVRAMIAAGADVSHISEMFSDGSFVGFVEPSTIMRLVDELPHVAFDGNLFRTAYTKLQQLPEAVAAQQQQQVRRRFLSCLQDAFELKDQLDPDLAIRDRAAASLRFLRNQIN